MDAARNVNRRPVQHLGFTLMELLVVIMLIGILTSFVLVALAGAAQTAKEDRTNAQIRKIHELIMEKWEQYQYRRIPPTQSMLMVQRGNTSIQYERLARDRLAALREVMRMELPSFQWDVYGDDVRDDTTKKQVTLDALWTPSNKRKFISPVTRAYLRRIAQAQAETGVAWTDSGGFQDAECLYLILSQIRTRDESALSFFSESEIGDIDGDGMKEILDAWGNPIRWTLWAPGYVSPMQPSLAENQQQDDILDVSQVGSGYQNTTGDPLIPDRWEGDFAALPRTLVPLIYSGGPDGQIGTLPWTQDSNERINQNWAAVSNDPYDRTPRFEMYRIGAPNPKFPDSSADDISNHYLMTR